MGRIFADRSYMKTSLRFIFSLFIFGLSIFATPFFAHGQNGFNIQSMSNKNRIIFVKENSKIKVKLDNGKECMGNLSGADSNAIYITGNNGKQKAIAIGSITRLTIFHQHDYFTLMDGSLGAGADGCGNNCSLAEAAVVLVAIVAITAGELIVDGIADIANDEHYDLKNNWRIIGPVIGR